MPPISSQGSRRAESALLLLIVLVCGWFIFARAARLDVLFRREPSGYYGLLVQGFRGGHLYAKLDPEPGLLALANPYDPVANAPYRAHDLSLYHGRYYLYFGVTPVLIFFWPIGALTGWYPTQVCAVAVFCFAGILAGVALLAAIRRRHFPGAPFWSLGVGALALFLANPVRELTLDGAVYNVPIACAFCLNLCLLGAIYRALHAERGRVGWMAAASFLFGLAVGARPDYILTGLVLVVAWLQLWRQDRDRRTGSAWRGGLAMATFVPAALCGLGLALYNRERFGSVLEFGMRYQLAGKSFLDFQPLALIHLWPNGSAYLFAAGIWQRYFPFFSAPADAGYGVLRYLPWCWLAPFAFRFVDARQPGVRRDHLLMPALVLVGSLANFLVLSCFFFGTNARYQSDYAPGFILLGGMGALALAARLASRPRAAWGKMAIIAAGLFSIGLNLAAWSARDSQADRLTRLARFCNQPAALLERVAGIRYGPLRLELQLPPLPGRWAEPIFETGQSETRYDRLQLAYLPGNRAQLVFFHAGLGLISGLPFSIPSNRRLKIEAQCGSLLPPWAHPIFAGLTPGEYDAVSRELRVAVGGVEVLHSTLTCYPSGPTDLHFGTNRWRGDGVSHNFGGQILSVQRVAFAQPAPPLPVLHEGTTVVLRVVFPADRESGLEPLLATGQGQLSDLLYCSYEGPGRMRLALDHSDSGGPRGDLFSYDPAQPHVLEIWLGSLVKPPAEARVVEAAGPDRRIFVKLDGRTVLDEVARFNPASPETILVGRNPFASTDISSHFTGSALGLSAEANPAPLPPVHSAGTYGAIDLSVLFPQEALGASEPLVVTGVTGAGDILYVRYLDGTHVGLGFDHWGVGGFSGPPVKVDFNQSHRLEITIGFLYPAGVSAARAVLVRVKLDGQVVLDGTSPCHPSDPGAIQVGRNPIGGSTCGPIFTGRILSLRHLPLAGQ